MSCFGSFGQTASWFLFALANFELLLHDETWQRQGLDLLVDPSALSQYHHTTTMLFAIDILLLDLDMLLPRLLLCIHLLCLAYLFLLPRTVSPSLVARNRPGPADSLLLSSQSSVLSSSFSSSIS